MHAMFFGVKRVHLRLLHVSRVLLGGKHLTPARFDMMRIVQLHPEGVAQSKIQYLLGVSGATVSRMLKSLEALGFVTRQRMTEDGRCRMVSMTPLGLYRVRVAVSSLIDSLVADRLAWRALAFDRAVAWPQLAMLERFLSTVRRNLGDPSPYPHPWRFEELSEYVVTEVVDGRIACREFALASPFSFG